MIRPKHILTTNQEPNRLYIPPTIEVVEVEEECVLAGGSIKGEDEDFNTDDESDTDFTAKKNFIFFYDDLPENTNEDNLDY